MPSKVFNSTVALNNYLENAVPIAIKNASEKITCKLEEFIKKDFYDMYKPKFYDRTYMFLKSGKNMMTDKNTAKIYIDTDVMHYLGVSGEDVANMASFGFHGTIDIFRPGFYWSDFCEWFNENAPIILKEELLKQGIKTI